MLPGLVSEIPDVPEFCDGVGIAGQAEEPAQGISLPDDFQARVRALLPLTRLAIPSGLRKRHTEVWAATLEGLAQGSREWSLLEEARSKLLLYACPRHVHGPRELAEQVAMWQWGEFEALLVRSESQVVLKRN